MAKHTHLTPLLVQAIRSGSVPARSALEIVLRKLAACCADCRRVLELEEAPRPGLVPASAYRAPVARATAELRGLARRLEREYAEAARLVDPLRPLSPEQRLLRVRNSLDRFARVPVGELVLGASRACLPGDPAGSRAWAELAGLLAARYDPPLEDHRVRALALRGNAHRALGDFATGRRLLVEARELCRGEGMIDPETGAAVDSFLGSLHIDLAEWEAALEHLDRAASTYALTGDTLGRSRTFIKQGILHGLLDRTEEALAADLAALEGLGPETDTTLYLLARLSYAFHLQEAGRADASMEVLEYDDTFYEGLESSYIEPRRAWLQARLDADFGDLASAERRYQALQHHFASRDDGFHAALVSIELATLYLQQGRLADLERIAHEALTLFRAQSFHADALTALLLLHRAARARGATLDQIRATLAAIRRTPRSALRPSE